MRTKRRYRQKSPLIYRREFGRGRDWKGRRRASGPGEIPFDRDKPAKLTAIPHPCRLWSASEESALER